MKAKTNTPKSIQRGLNQIKKDVGPDALILSTQEITSRRALGLFRRHKWVVTAAVNDTPAAPKISEMASTSILRIAPKPVDPVISRPQAKPETATPARSKGVVPDVASRL